MKQKNIDLGLLIFRITLGLLMFMHGFHKLLNGVEPIKGMLTDFGIPEFLAYGVHLGETIAPLFIIFGFRTRLAAFAFTFVMIVAFLMVHTQDFFAITGTGAWAHEGIALFLLGGLGLIFTGAGKYALSYKHVLD